MKLWKVKHSKKKQIKEEIKVTKKKKKGQSKEKKKRINREEERKRKKERKVKGKKKKKRPSIFTPNMHSEPPHERTAFPSILSGLNPVEYSFFPTPTPFRISLIALSFVSTKSV